MQTAQTDNAVMAKDRSKGNGTQHGKPTSLRIGLLMPPEYRKALEDLSARTRRTMTTEILIALERHFRAEGIWSDK